ncbi:MAG: segregation/condensation protein A [Thermodesulfobacteriota bacterium]
MNEPEDNLTEAVTVEGSRTLVRLPVFEGPLDLLYHLIRKNEVDITDIPIAKITDQYLAYLALLRELNIELAGEFLVMAATLMHIKSRMLLPRHEGLEEDEDPRLLIVRPLAEHVKIKEAAARMRERPMLFEDVFLRGPEELSFPDQDSGPLVQVGLFELIAALSQVLARAPDKNVVTLTADTVSVKERINEIVDVLEREKTVAFEELFSKSPTRGEIVVTFLALLEMVKLSIIRIVQHVQSGVIRLFYA